MSGQEKNSSPTESISDDNETGGSQVADKLEGLHIEDKTEGLQIEDKTEGLQVEDKTEGLHIEDKTEGLPFEDKTECLHIEDKTEGLQVEDKTEGLLVEDKTEGLHIEDKTEGLQVEDKTEGLKVEDKSGGAQVEDKSGSAQVEDKSGGTHVDNETVGLHKEDKAEGLHVEESGVLLVQREKVSPVDPIQGNLTYWREKARDERKSARQTQLKNLNGMHTTVCIDVSDSMKHNDAWEQAKIFFTEYLSGIREEFAQKRKHQNTALVTFGHDTKVQHRLTKDLKALEQSFENITLGGPSPLLAGLILAKASSTVSNYRFANVNDITVPPRIIVVTDGKATDVNEVNELYKQDQNESANGVKQLIIKEVADIRDDDIEIHFVYVGNPDIVFLQKLQEASRGQLIPHTSGRSIAKDIIFKCILKQDQESLQKAELRKQKKDKAKHIQDAGSDKESVKVEGSVDEDKGDSDEENPLSSMTDVRRKLKKMLLPGIHLGNSDSSDNDSDEDSQSLLKMLGIQAGLGLGPLDIKRMTDAVEKNSVDQDFYEENKEMQKYAPIGSRVRRGRDWRWGNQDNSYLGTIIGHSYDKLKKHWCWVEWDANGQINAYRWHINGPCDLKIVEEDRIPVDGKIFDVGSRVRQGLNYKGEHQHKEGIVIKLIDEKTIQVRWKDDGSREDLSFSDENCASCEVEPVLFCFDDGSRMNADECKTPLASLITGSGGLIEEAKIEPYAPIDIEVYDIFEQTACLKWQKSTEDADISKSKYVVTYGETKNPQKKTTLEVTATLSCTLDDLKAGSEYIVGVKLVDGRSESLQAFSNSFTTMETDIDDSHYAGWPLTERDAARLTSAIGDNWEMLGPELGIGHIPIRHIKTDNQSSISSIYHMLLRWIHQDRNPTFGKFINSLQKLPEVSIDRTVIDSMKHELRLMEMEMEKNKKQMK